MSRATATRGLLFGAAMFLSPSRSRAEESVRFHLVYNAPPTCPSSSAFLSAIRTRTERPRLAADNEVATTFALRFGDDANGGATGHLEIRDPDGSTQERTVTSHTCAEVAKALALIVALVLDPDADTSRETVVGPPPPPAPRPTPPRPPAPALPAHPLVVALGAEAGVRGAVGPAIAPAGGLFVDVELGGRSPGWWSPAARLGIDVATTSSALTAGSHDYLWVAGILRVCPIHVTLTPAVRAAPCVGMEVGRHRGTTHDVPKAGAYAELWLAPEAIASLSWAATTHIALELQSGFVVPLRPTRFFLDPDVTIYRVPRIAGTVSAAVLIRFR